MQLRIAKTLHREFWHCATHALDECRAEVWQVVWQVVELGSNLGPIRSEQGRKTGCKTQNQPKRTNHIGSVSLPWAQGVGGSNPLAPPNIFFCTSEFWKRQSLQTTTWVQVGSK